MATPATQTVSPIRFENAPAMTIAGLSLRSAGLSMSQIPALWQRFAPHLGALPGRMGEITYGVVYGNEASTDPDYLCGVEVRDIAKLPPNFSHVRTPAQRYAVYAHLDHVSKISGTVHAIFASGHAAQTLPGFMERYGPKFDPRSGAGDIEIWVPQST